MSPELVDISVLSGRGHYGGDFFLCVEVILSFLFEYLVEFLAIESDVSEHRWIKVCEEVEVEFSLILVQADVEVLLLLDVGKVHPHDRQGLQTALACDVELEVASNNDPASFRRGVHYKRLHESELVETIGESLACLSTPLARVVVSWLQLLYRYLLDF